MRDPEEFDVVVLGGGPAGVTAALRARELGATAALVERDRMGGTCTNDGCAPTRVLARAARLRRNAEQFADYGLTGDPPEVDFEGLVSRTQRIIYEIQEKKQLIQHLRDSGASVYTGSGAAAFDEEHIVRLDDGTRLRGERFILCVGGRARRLDFPGSEHALTHSDVWSLKRLPRSVVIVGAAATGCQLASIFNAFGCEVRLLDIAARILPTEDGDLSRAMSEAFNRHGVEVHTEIDGLERIEKEGDQLRLYYGQDGQERMLAAEAVLLAVGWRGNIEALNLPAAGVESEGGYVRVDDYLRTSAPHVYAAGDVTGRTMLVQSASYDARIATENAVMEADKPYVRRIAPHGGFTDPEYGSVGLTEEQARADSECVWATVPYAELDRAVIDGLREGLCKLIVSRETHRILGAHVVGEQAVEIVSIVAASMAAGIRVDQLAEVELAYPTYTAIVGLAARRLVHALGAVPLAKEWRELGKPLAAEWERTD